MNGGGLSWLFRPSKLTNHLAAQSQATAITAATVVHLLDYAATHPNATTRYHASDMILYNCSDASFLSELKAVTWDSIRGNHIVSRRLCKCRYLYYELRVISDWTINFIQILVEHHHREQAIRDSVIMTLMSDHAPSQPRSLPTTEEFAQRVKGLFLQVLGKMVSDVDLAVDFINVN